MKLKSLFPTALLLPVLILLPPTADGCVNLFAAQGYTNNVVQSTWLDAKLWDGSGGSFSQVCTLSNNPDGTYDLTTYVFTCNSGYSAQLSETDSSGNTWTLQYFTPHGSYTLATDYLQCGGSAGPWCDSWKSCEYGCSQGDSDCFVYGCGVDYRDCAPP